jgi:hypothetical protein
MSYLIFFPFFFFLSVTKSIFCYLPCTIHVQAISTCTLHSFCNGLC